MQIYLIYFDMLENFVYLLNIDAKNSSKTLDLKHFTIILLFFFYLPFYECSGVLISTRSKPLDGTIFVCIAKMLVVMLVLLIFPYDGVSNTNTSLREMTPQNVEVMKR